MNNDFTQHHHWGITEHGLRQLIFKYRIADETLWEFLTPEEVLENAFGIDCVNDFLNRGGGFLLTDRPDPLPRFHDVELWAYHADPRMLTWITLKLK